MALHDISPRLHPGLAVWPGDTPLRRRVLQDMESGDGLTLSALEATVHLGAHADAPSHTSAKGGSIETRPLEPYLGHCQVMHVDCSPSSRIRIEDLGGTVQSRRLLLATGTFPDPNGFNEDFAAPDPSLIDHLAEAGVILLGVDTPSVDLFHSKDLPSHARLLEHDMAILEGLVLRNIPNGFYEVIALPLALAGFDASPVRAILRDLP